MSKRRHVFTGTRRALADWEQALIQTVLREAGLDDCEQGYDEWHHGGASGVDDFIDNLGFVWGLKVVRHPADWEKYGKKAGPIRNREMLDSAGFVKLWAFPSKEKSVGTIDCIRAAMDRRMDLEVVWLS